MNKLKQTLGEPFWQVFAGLFVIEALLLPHMSYTPDTGMFVKWADNLRELGLGLAYQTQPTYNYPPLMAYTLWLFAKLLGTPANVAHYINFYKLFPLAFDFAAAATVAKFAGDRRREILYFLLLAANPIFIYNSFFWGQTDAVYGALVLFALVSALKDRPVWTLLFYTLAISFKPQALVYAPLFGLILLWKWPKPWSLLRIFAAVSAAALLQFTIILPFILAGQTWQTLGVVGKTVGFYHVISLNAYNFWHLFYGRQALLMDDTTDVFAGLSAHAVGLMLFFGLSFLALLSFFTAIVKAKLRCKPLTWSTENLLLMFALITLLFFFCTQMHERYPQPAILFLAAYVFLMRRHYWLLLVMVPYGLNMEYALRAYQFDSYDGFLFDSRFIASLYTLFLLALGNCLYIRSTYRQICAAQMSLNLRDGESTEVKK